MTVRFYSSVAPPTTLTAGITAGSAAIQVASTTGFPALTPYTLSLSFDTSGEELVQVNSVGGTTLQVTRGIDGTSATSHNAGVEVRHVTSARDFADSRTHENSDDGVHGLAVGEELVGTDKVQTLSNKTLNMAKGSLNQIDIFNTGSWTTTINGDVGFPAVDILQIKPTSSSNATWRWTPGGQMVAVNTAINDVTPTNYKFRLTRNDGTTDVFYILSGGSMFSRLENGQDGLTMRGSADAVRRRAMHVMNAAGSVTRVGIYTDGTGFFQSSSTTNPTMDLRLAAGQTANALHVQNSAGTEIANIDQSGAFNGRAVAVDDSITSPAYAITGGLPLRPSQRNTELVSFVAQTSFTVNVVFPQAFTVIPSVVTNINSGDGTTARWDSRAISISTTGFTLFLYRGVGTDPAQTWVNIPVSWIATQ